MRVPSCGAVSAVAAVSWWPAPNRRMCSNSGIGRWGLQTVTSARPTHRVPRRSCRSCRARSRSKSQTRRSPWMPATRSSSAATCRTPTPMRGGRSPDSRWPCSSPVWGRGHGRRVSMPDLGMLETFLAGGQVEAAVFALRPDYRAIVLAVDGLVPGPSDQGSDALLRAAEAAAREALRDRPVEQLPHVAAWRATYRAFGAKPQRTRHNPEALLRRAGPGLPRVNRLTDVYNAVSVLHQIPLGGEDLMCYSGAPRLVRATGTEPFDTVANGTPLTDYPEVGEVVWCDDAGVTCRRWNWRQAHRTQLRDDTTAALFILDALAPITDQALHAAAEELLEHLGRLGPDVRAVQRLIAANTTHAEGA